MKIEPSSLDVNEKLASADLVSAAGLDSISVSGAVVSTVHAKVAALASAFPAASVARTSNVCPPSARPAYDGGTLALGEGRAVERALEGRALLARRERERGVHRVREQGRAGVDRVSGGAVSTVQERSAALGSVLPASSVACTAKVCRPSARPSYRAGLSQAVNAAPSSEHARLEPSSLKASSKLALASFVRVGGPAVIDVSGAVVSILQERLAALSSLLPAASVARTEKVCVPSVSASSRTGDVQPANGASSSEHSNSSASAGPLSAAPNANVANARLVSVGGPESIAVSGGTATVQT